MKKSGMLTKHAGLSAQSALNMLNSTRATRSGMWDSKW